MSVVVLTCPKQWDGPAAIQFANECCAASGRDQVKIDFAAAEFVKPFGTLIIANSIKDLVARRRASADRVVALVPKGDVGAASYLRHIGFFQYIGIDTGKKPGEAHGSTTYVPIRTITLEELKIAAPGGVFQNGVEIVAERLAEVVTPRIMEQIMMQYCLREVVRNVFEHAETDHCTVLAQRYSNGWAEIAIADDGIGIYGSLRRSLALQSIDEALEMAIKPGISRVTQRQNRDEWDNSGFGLFVLSELGRELGEFMLASNGRYVQIHRYISSPAFASVQVPGTAIKLLIDLKGAEYFPNQLQQLIRRGEDAHYSETGIAKTASKRSKSVGGVEPGPRGAHDERMDGRRPNAQTRLLTVEVRVEKLGRLWSLELLVGATGAGESSTCCTGRRCACARSTPATTPTRMRVRRGGMRPTIKRPASGSTRGRDPRSLKWRCSLKAGRHFQEVPPPPGSV